MSGDRLPAQPMTGACPAPPSRPGAEGRARGGLGWNSGGVRRRRGTAACGQAVPPQGSSSADSLSFPPALGWEGWEGWVLAGGGRGQVGGPESIRVHPGQADQ